jgi:hypothetical protein
VAKRDNARQELYRANMVAAAAALQLHNSPAARRFLETAPEEFRPAGFQLPGSDGALVGGGDRA